MLPSLCPAEGAEGELATMTEGREQQTAGGVAADAALACGLTALGIGSLVAGKVALGGLSLILLGGHVVGWTIRRRGSDATLLRFVVAKPFFFGGWLIAMAGVIIASQRSLDWVLILPLGVAYIGLGVLLLALHRRSRREGERSG
jgi:hypothetical protein